MKDKKLRNNILLKSIGFLFLPFIGFAIFSFLIYPMKPHCSLGDGVLGCTSICEPTSFFENGKPAGYQEVPCYHDEPTIIQTFMFNNPWFVILIIVIPLAFLIYKKDFKLILKKIAYIALAPFFLLKENRKNKSIISRIFVIFISFFLIIEWLIGYYVVITTFRNNSFTP